MPDFIQKTHNGMPTGKTDWTKIFMGFAMALVFVMQQYHDMELAGIKANVVPRAEYETRHRQTIQKDTSLDVLKEFSKRLEAIEAKINEK